MEADANGWNPDDARVRSTGPAAHIPWQTVNVIHAGSSPATARFDMTTFEGRGRALESAVEERMRRDACDRRTAYDRVLSL